MSKLTADQVLASVKLVPFSTSSYLTYQNWTQVLRRNYLDLCLPSSWNTLDTYMSAGALKLQSESLHMHFILANVDAGRGFFGGQKTRLATYVSMDGGETYDVGPVLKDLIQGLTGINNIYRDAGILKGVAY